MSDFKKYKLQQKIGNRLTVVETIATARGRHPVYLVWDHHGWCPAICKIFRNSRKALQEHEVLAAVAHPNIVKSLGTYEPDIMLMEYLQGQTLGDYARAKTHQRLSLPDALRAIIHLGGALQHVHQKGYMHLDVKPSNVIVANNRPVLFDFGTARKIGATRPPAVQGTDAYMAPEECVLGDINTAADVFSLGVTLFELLTGRLPYAAGTKTTPYPQLTSSPRLLRKFRPDLPRALEALVAQCLERNHEKRPKLVQLLPELNCFIRKGPRMWPELLDLRAA